mmetsp:Transcript_48322/g.113071  ORF Transcript_48322/g.113071 Transcript_48322/m.113071 type:complete len:311 (-) Transcript_48322:362-1294(-)
MQASVPSPKLRPTFTNGAIATHGCSRCHRGKPKAHGQLLRRCPCRRRCPHRLLHLTLFRAMWLPRQWHLLFLDSTRLSSRRSADAGPLRPPKLSYRFLCRLLRLLPPVPPGHGLAASKTPRGDLSGRRSGPPFRGIFPRRARCWNPLVFTGLLLRASFQASCGRGRREGRHSEALRSLCRSLPRLGVCREALSLLGPILAAGRAFHRGRWSSGSGRHSHLQPLRSTSWRAGAPASAEEPGRGEASVSRSPLAGSPDMAAVSDQHRLWFRISLHERLLQCRDHISRSGPRIHRHPDRMHGGIGRVVILVLQ